MDTISLRILDGPERGQQYLNLSLPITIGREKGNNVVIDDERISRIHLRIFEEAGILLLVDLGSTNGTRINGEPVQIWKLRPGDLILIGNSSLVCGTEEDIAERLRNIRLKIAEGSARFMGLTPSESPSVSQQDISSGTASHSLLRTTSFMLENELFQNVRKEDLVLLRSLFPPKLPSALTSKQTAELGEIFFYFCLRFRTLVDEIRSVNSGEVNLDELRSLPKKKSPVKKEKNPSKPQEEDSSLLLSQAQWQNLLDLYGLISQYVERLASSNH